jgi:roadblock/LC7 domain-containing protein
MQGELVASRAKVAKDCSDLMEMMIAAKLFMGKIEQRLEEKGENNYTDAGFAPIKGIALSAGEYSICVIGNVGIFVETAKVDFRGVFKSLGKEAGVI